MRWLIPFALLALISGCGNDSTGNAMAMPLKGLMAKLASGGGRPVVAPDPNDPAIKAGMLAFRAQLEADGQPIILVSNEALKYGTFHAPFGQNRDVRTWSSTSYQTIALRGGIMIATRGFGPDLMSAVAPTVAQIARGTGSTDRRYFYLDGADQPQSHAFTCTLASGGSERIEVMAKPFATRKVSESCSGPAGSFVNQYWFDHGLNIRQSSQYIAPGLSNFFMQGVVD